MATKTFKFDRGGVTFSGTAQVTRKKGAGKTCRLESLKLTIAGFAELDFSPDQLDLLESAGAGEWLWDVSTEVFAIL